MYGRFKKWGTKENKTNSTRKAKKSWWNIAVLDENRRQKRPSDPRYEVEVAIKKRLRDGHTDSLRIQHNPVDIAPVNYVSYLAIRYYNIPR